MLFQILTVAVILVLITLLVIFFLRNREQMHPTYMIRNVDGISYATECKADQPLEECAAVIDYHIQEPSFQVEPRSEQPTLPTQNRLTKPVSERILSQDNITVSNRYRNGFTRNVDGITMASRCISA